MVWRALSSVLTTVGGVDACELTRLVRDCTAWAVAWVFGSEVSRRDRICFDVVGSKRGSPVGRYPKSAANGSAGWTWEDSMHQSTPQHEDLLLGACFPTSDDSADL